MFMPRVGTSPENEILRELDGARVLLTGLTASAGVDVARAFADIKARLVIHTTDLSPEVTTLIALLSQSAREIKLYTAPLTGSEAPLRFAQTAAQVYGGLDAVINLASIDESDMEGVASKNGVEQLVSNKLMPLAHLTGTTANRMRLVLSEGLILNVMNVPRQATARHSAICAFARTALASMTKSEAHAWAPHGIRINAVGPEAVVDGQQREAHRMSNEPDIAALAIYLASRRGRGLSGHIFDCGATSDRI